jgi:hypothetical protein
VPEAVTADIETDDDPVFAMVTLRELLVPVVRLPKLSDVGLAATADGVAAGAATPVPTKGTDAWILGIDVVIASWSL